MNDLEDEKEFLQQQVSILTQRGGISESTVNTMASKLKQISNKHTLK